MFLLILYAPFFHLNDASRIHYIELEMREYLLSISITMYLVVNPGDAVCGLKNPNYLGYCLLILCKILEN